MAGLVEAKIASVGIPTAAATCMAPESLPKNPSQRDSSAARSAGVVRPAG